MTEEIGRRMKKIRVALIGVGARGEGLYRVDLKKCTNVEFIALVADKLILENMV